VLEREPARELTGDEAPKSSTVPFEQIGQSAVKRLWRQKSVLTFVGRM